MPSLWKAATEALAPIWRPAGTVIAGVQSSDWASPVQPIRPANHPGIGVRSWDFTPGINQQYTPRGDAPINFAQLRNVARSFDLCTLMIETRKDQIVNRPWVIRVKPIPGEQKKARLEREAKNPNVTKVTNLLKYPDGYNSFDLWIRMWLDDLLVFDAPTIYPVRNMLGDVMSLRVISGPTITPLVDEQGFIPLPPNPAYQQIILGMPTTNLTAVQKEEKKFTADQLVYRPRNPRVASRWGFSPVEQIIVTLSIGANRQQFLRDYYTSGNTPEGFMPMPEGWTPAQIKDFQTWLDGKLAGNLAQRRRLIATPDTKHPVQFSKSEALTDVTDEYLIRVVAFAFSISPQNLIKQVNRGTAKESSDTAQIEGLEPYLKHVENTMNFVIERTLGIEDVEFAYQDEREMDPLKQAQTDQIYISTGTYTRNEIREARGDDPRPEPEADELGVITANGFVALGDTPDPQQGGDEQEPTQGKTTPSLKLRKGHPITLKPRELTPNSRRAKGEMARIVGKFLDAQKKRVIAGALAGFKKFKKADELETDTARAAAIIANIGWDYETLYNQVLPYLETAGEEGASAGAFQLAAAGASGLSGVEGPAKEAAREWAANRSAEMIGAKLDEDGWLTTDTAAKWAISDTAKKDVENTVKMALEESWTPKQLEAVLEASALFTQSHADLIATQEVQRAQAWGHFLAWKETRKVAEVAWKTSATHPEIDICDKYAAQGSVKLGHEFGIGVFGPQDNHPHCECYLAVTKFEDED